MYYFPYSNRLFFLFLTILIISSSTFAKNKEDACDKKECFPESSSTWNLIETKDIVEKNRKLLNDKFNNLIKHKSLTHQKKILVKQHLSWLKFTKDRCEFIGETSGAGGHWSYVQTNNCLIKHYESRIDLMKSTLICLQMENPNKSKDFGFNYCIENFHQIIVADRELFY